MKLKNQRLKECRRYGRYLRGLELRMMPPAARRWTLQQQYDWWWATYWSRGSDAGMAVPWSVICREQGRPGRSYRR